MSRDNLHRLLDAVPDEDVPTVERILTALVDLEERQDLEDFRAAKREFEKSGEAPVPLDELKADLGP